MYDYETRTYIERLNVCMQFMSWICFKKRFAEMLRFGVYFLRLTSIDKLKPFYNVILLDTISGLLTIFIELKEFQINQI